MATRATFVVSADALFLGGVTFLLDNVVAIQKTPLIQIVLLSSVCLTIFFLLASIGFATIGIVNWKISDKALMSDRHKVSKFLTCNQVEFKGREDPLTIRGYHLIGGRTQLYLGEQDVAVPAMTVTIICAARPRTVLTHVQPFQPFKPIAAGYYKNEAHPPVYLIVINELPLIPKNYALLLFASSDRKFRQFLETLVIEGNTRYLRYAYEIRPHMTREVLTMAGISTTISRKDLEFMAEDIGPELIPFLKPQDLLRRMNAQKQREFISLLSPEEILANISVEDLIKRMGPEQQIKLFELLLKNLSASLADKEKYDGKNGNN